MKEFPHLRDTDFPKLSTVDPYAIKIQFDYTRWDVETKVKLLNVNWRGDYANTVKFESDAARDAWFDAQSGHVQSLVECCRLKHDRSIKLPIPFDIMAQYNYIAVEYPVATSEALPIDYETSGGKRKYFYFIDDTIQRAPNTTECVLQLDVWTTYINDCEFQWMMLERGHAPLAAVGVDEYLASPIGNSSLLLAPDVDYGEAGIVRKSDACVFNDDDMMVCFATTCDPQGDFGTPHDDWTVTDAGSVVLQGVPNGIRVFALLVSDYQRFLAAVRVNAPQFIPTVQGVFLISEKLIVKGTPFMFMGVQCVNISGAERSVYTHTLTKEDFGYDERYAGKLAKLYTSPYAHIELTDGKRSVTVRIEDTDGTIALNALTEVAFPILNINAVFTGIGGVTSELSFRNMDERRFRFGGKWYDIGMDFKVPVYALVQSSRENYDFSTDYSRTQETESTYLTANQNWRVADMNEDNAKIATDAAVANQRAANAASQVMTELNNSKLEADKAADILYNESSTAAQVNLTQQTANVNTATTIGTGAIGAAAGVVVMGAATTASGGAAAIAGIVYSVGSAAVGVYGAIAGSANTITNSQVILAASNTMIRSKTANATSNNTAMNANQQIVNLDMARRANNAIMEQSTNTNELNKTIFSESRDMQLKGISRKIAEASIKPASMFGAMDCGIGDAAKPLACWFNVVTERDGEIAAAGDAMLRYGYNLNQAWRFTDFNIMSKFTYWKLSDLWLSDPASVVEGAQETIRGILLGGVTVWRNPEEIGRISIYENEVVHE